MNQVNTSTGPLTIMDAKITLQALCTQLKGKAGPYNNPQLHHALCAARGALKSTLTSAREFQEHIDRIQKFTM
jgi:hypothetical protein